VISVEQRKGEAIMNTERELTIDELDAISGGTTIAPNRQTINARMDLAGGGGGGDAGPAIAAWNTLLHQYGAA
jgi:bacteriocin-like protein